MKFSVKITAAILSGLLLLLLAACDPKAKSDPSDSAANTSSGTVQNSGESTKQSGLRVEVGDEGAGMVVNWDDLISGNTAETDKP